MDVNAAWTYIHAGNYAVVSTLFILDDNVDIYTCDIGPASVTPLRLRSCPGDALIGQF